MSLLREVVLGAGRRTVTTARRILGRECDPDFCTFHRVLNRAPRAMILPDPFRRRRNSG
jgi:hypothetical protein